MLTDERIAEIEAQCERLKDHYENQLETDADDYLIVWDEWRTLHDLIAEVKAAREREAKLQHSLTTRNAELNAEMSEWQPISTAPKDGTDFLAAWGDHDEFHVVRIQDGQCRRAMDPNPWMMPTLWQPLPSRPSQSGA